MHILDGCYVTIRQQLPTYKNAPDLLNDKVVMFQDKYYVPLVIAVHAGHFLDHCGWAVGDVVGVLLLGGLLRLILSHHVTFFINSLCHMWANVLIPTKTLHVTISC